MAFESNHSSLIWDSTGSPQQFQSSSLSNIPDQYNQSLVAPLTLSQRKRNSHSTNLRLPPLKLRSTITFHSSETENTLPNTTTSSTRELRKLRDKFDRIRATLSVRFFFLLEFSIEKKNISIKNRLYLVRGMCACSYLLISLEN
jgi:hypothetical protein